MILSRSCHRVQRKLSTKRKDAKIMTLIDRDAKYKVVPKICVTCGASFCITNSDNKRGRGKFCNANCHRPGAILVNTQFFSNPSPEMAYVLGVIASDGNLSDPRNGHRARLSIKSIDLQMLEVIKLVSGNEGAIFFSGKTQSGNNTYRIEWSHPQIIEDVKRWGIHPRKTLTIEFPKDLPVELWRDFIRGVFDGDGWVHLSKDRRRVNSYNRQWGLLGTRSVLEPIPEYFQLDDKISAYKQICKLVYQSLPAIEKIYQTLYYRDNLPCLERKRIKLIEIVNLGCGRRSAERRKAKKLELVEASDN